MTKKNLRPFWCWNVAGCGSLQNFQQFPRQNITIYIYNIYIYHISWCLSTWFQPLDKQRSSLGRISGVSFSQPSGPSHINWLVFRLWKTEWEWCTDGCCAFENGIRDGVSVSCLCHTLIDKLWMVPKTVWWFNCFDKNHEDLTQTHTQELNYEHGLAPSLHQCSPLPCSLCRDRCQLARVLASPSGFSGGPGHVKPVGTWTCR